jgi:hypothetical protein
MNKDVFDLRERNREERKTHKTINKFGSTLDKNSFINFRVFLFSSFLSQTKHTICD